MTAGRTTRLTRDAVVRHNPVVQQRYGNRVRAYLLVGGSEVTYRDGRVEYTCDDCEFVTRHAHGITTHRSWRHTGNRTAWRYNVQAHQAATVEAEREPGSHPLVVAVRALQQRTREAEATALYWRRRAEAAEASLPEWRRDAG